MVARVRKENQPVEDQNGGQVNTQRGALRQRGEYPVAERDRTMELSPHKHDRGKQDSQRKNERGASDPGGPCNHGVIGAGSALRRER